LLQLSAGLRTVLAKRLEQVEVVASVAGELNGLLDKNSNGKM